MRPSRLMTTRNVCESLRKIRSYLWSGTNKVLLLKNMDVACYAADPLASDSDDEKKIRKVIKETKQLRDEKRRNSCSKVTRPKGVIPRSSDSRVILDRNSASELLPFVAEKQNQACDERSVCFRSFKPGHFATDCRAANVFNKAGSAGQTSSNYQQPA